MWRYAWSRYPSIHFTARWPFLVEHLADDKVFAGKFWQDDLDDVRRADVVLIYALNEEERLRGALVEAGAGLILGKNLAIIGEHQDYGTWQFHPQVTRYSFIDDALSLMSTDPVIFLCP
jgi:hypothetical protein